MECEQKVNRATSLISELGTEQTRWEQTVERLEARLQFVLGDIIMGSGIIAYLGMYIIFIYIQDLFLKLIDLLKYLPGSITSNPNWLTTRFLYLIISHSKVAWATQFRFVNGLSTAYLWILSAGKTASSLIIRTGGHFSSTLRARRINGSRRTRVRMRIR